MTAQKVGIVIILFCLHSTSAQDKKKKKIISRNKYVVNSMCKITTMWINDLFRWKKETQYNAP